MMYLFNSIFGLPPSLHCLLTHIPSAGSVSRPPLPLLPFLRVLINAFVRVMAKCGLRITGRERRGMPPTLIGYLVSNERTNGGSGGGGEGLTAHSRFLSSDRTTQSNPRERSPQWFACLLALSNPEIIVDLQGGFERVDPQIMERWSGLFGPWLLPPSLVARSATTERTHPLPSSSLSSFPKTEDGGGDDSRIGRHSQMNADEASGLLSLSLFRLEDRQRNLLFIELSRGIGATHPRPPAEEIEILAAWKPFCKGDRHRNCNGGAVAADAICDGRWG